MARRTRTGAGRRIGAAALLAGALAAGAAAAESSLIGRGVTFGVLAYDDPDRPIFQGRRHRAVVGEGVEFGLRGEGAQNGFDVVPAIVDIGPRRVVVSTATSPPGDFAEAEFNGYVLAFEAECLLFAGASVDGDATNLPVAADAVTVTGDTVMVDVAGLTHDRTSVLAIDLEITDCALS